MDPLPTGLLRSAYSQGYFPMPHPKTGQTQWLRPDPRAILPLNNFHLSHSLARVIKKKWFRVTYNRSFSQIIRGCQARVETWITDEFVKSYENFHREGFAHSVEVWKEGKIAGGLYGVAIGGAFFAESMFYRIPNASKVALFYLVQRLKDSGFGLLEVQFLTPHLKSLGAIEISDATYQKLLKHALRKVPLETLCDEPACMRKR